MKFLLSKSGCPTEFWTEKTHGTVGVTEIKENWQLIQEIEKGNDFKWAEQVDILIMTSWVVKKIRKYFLADMIAVK